MNNTYKPETASSDKDDTTMIGSVASDIKGAVAQKFGQAMTEVRSKAEDAKDGVADEVNDVASALRRASEELRGGSAQERTLGTLASGLADASDQIRDKDLGQIVQMVSKVARENPMMFLGGAALLGFAASRYAKASSTSGAASTAPKAGGSSVGAFVNEGNPNTQAARTAP
ncbi:MAG: hypothetical protein ACK4HF_16330 [Paracoccaceae bacterium]